MKENITGEIILRGLGVYIKTDTGEREVGDIFRKYENDTILLSIKRKKRLRGSGET